MMPTMTSVLSTDRADDFLAASGAYLRSRPAEHSVILTNSEARVDVRDADNLWAWAQADDETVVATAMHTPPFGAYVSLGADDAIRQLAGHLHERGRKLPGVGGLRPQAEVFADEWVRRAGGVAKPSMRQGIYVADRVTPPDGVPGRLRSADAGDLPLLREWVAGFHADTGLPPEGPNDLEVRVASGRLCVWVVDGRPVSMAGATAPAAGVSRVQYVYTPPDQRGRGYASACVAALTARELAVSGRTCMLYTDLANPTSNGIYQAVGYRRLGEAVQLAFGQGRVS